MPVIRPTYKTRMCEFYLKNSCMKGDKCSYAHGEHELRSRSSTAAHHVPLPANVWDFVNDEITTNAPSSIADGYSSAVSGSRGVTDHVPEAPKPAILIDASSMSFPELVAYAEGLLVAGAATTRGATCSFRTRSDQDAALFEHHLGSNGIESSRLGEFVIVDFRPRITWDMVAVASN